MPVVVTSDASSKGIVSVLFHKFTNKELKPIIYASGTLSDIENRNSNIDKEDLGIVFAVSIWKTFYIIDRSQDSRTHIQ